MSVRFQIVCNDCAAVGELLPQEVDRVARETHFNSQIYQTREVLRRRGWTRPVQSPNTDICPTCAEPKR